MRRFPPPWTVEAIEAGFKVIDANGQAVAYVYGHADKCDAETAKVLTLDEARRIASNIAKLPTLLGKLQLKRVCDQCGVKLYAARVAKERVGEDCLRPRSTAFRCSSDLHP